jgi:hypothetical protein
MEYWSDGTEKKMKSGRQQEDLMRETAATLADPIPVLQHSTTPSLHYSRFFWFSHA